MAKVKINALVREQKELALGIFDLRLEAPEIVSQAAVRAVCVSVQRGWGPASAAAYQHLRS